MYKVLITYIAPLEVYNLKFWTRLYKVRIAYIAPLEVDKLEFLDKVV